MSTIKASNYANRVGDKSVPAETVVNGTAKAWVNYKASSTTSIRNSFNLSSITNNGLGDFTCNWTNAFFGDYTPMGMGGSGPAGNATTTLPNYKDSNNTIIIPNVTNWRSRWAYIGIYFDSDVICIQSHGDLA